MAGLCLDMGLGRGYLADRGLAEDQAPGLTAIAAMFSAGAKALARLLPRFVAWVADRLRCVKRIRLPRLPVLRLPRLSPAPMAALPRPGPEPIVSNAP